MNQEDYGTSFLMRRNLGSRSFVWYCVRTQILLRQLSLGVGEKELMILGFMGVAIISPYPEIGTDVDKPSDLELAERVMSVRGSKEA